MVVERWAWRAVAGRQTNEDFGTFRCAEVVVYVVEVHLVGSGDLLGGGVVVVVELDVDVVEGYGSEDGPEVDVDVVRAAHGGAEDGGGVVGFVFLEHVLAVG